MQTIVTHNLTYKVGSKTILDGINLRIPEGSIYGYLGRNGAGKSTTIKFLLGLLSEPNDKITVLNKSLKHNRKEILSLTGNLVESPCFYSKLTVYENLKYLDLIYRKGENRIHEVLELVDLFREKRKRASVLSMGMKQRLGIAMAIYHDPQLLILDEPLNGLDPQGIYEMRNLFLKLNEQGKTIFLSSHILSELEKIATHIGIIENGKMIFQGTKAELLGKIDKEVVLNVNDGEKAKLILKNNFRIVRSDLNKITLRINNDNEFSTLIKSLVNGSVEIYGIDIQNTNLESTFISLISQIHDK